MDAARARGEDTLGEPDLFPVFRALGWRTPATRLLNPDEPIPDPGTDPAERMVVKLIAPGLAHRTDLGGVRIVGRTPEAVRAAVEALRALSDRPGTRVAVQEWVDHDHEPGGELLLGARWTDEFGPVVSLGLGGVAAEHLAALVSEGGGVLHVSPTLQGDEPSALAGMLRESPLTPLALGTLRNRPGRADEAGLQRALASFLALAHAAVPSLVDEIEINPLAFVEGQPVVLDALARVGRSGHRGVAPEAEMPEWRRQAIHALLRPRSIAVVGVSSHGSNPGRTILANVLAMGFPPEDVRVLKPGWDRLDGCVCVPDVEALDPPVDLLVVSVGAADVPDLIGRVAASRRARAIVLVSGGLGEGGNNRDAEEALRRVLRAAGPEAPVVNGGNCLGVRSWPGRSDTLFIPRDKLSFPAGPPHPVALVSQSGAFAIARASSLPWLNPRYVITVGNQIDLTVGEYLEVLAEDTDVRVFACYVEGLRPRDGLRFLRAAHRLTAEGRAVILHRAGRTGRGAEAAVSHTASLAGDYAVTRALAGEAGVLVTDRLDDFDDILRTAALLDGRTVGPRLAALSNAGFECVTLADGAGSLELGELSEGTRTRLAELVRSQGLEQIVTPRNPMDVTPIFDDRAFVQAAGIMLADEKVDVGVIACVPLTPALHTRPAERLDAEDGILAGLVELSRSTTKAWVAVVDGGPMYDAMADGLAAAGIPVFRRSDRAVAALARYARWKQRAGASSSERGARR